MVGVGLGGPTTEPEDMRELSLTQIRAIHVVGP